MRCARIGSALVVTATVAISFSIAGGEDAAPQPAPLHPLSRAAVIGASVSRGLSAGLPLAVLLDHSIHVPHEPVLNPADFAMGLSPLASGEAQVDAAIDHGATLVIAIDFLFWYVHFVPATKDEAAARLERLEAGLGQLDRIPAPIVVGDMPVMVDVPARRLPAAAIPSAAALESINARIREFAAARPRVLVAPLAAWLTELRGGKWRLPGSADGKAESTLLTPEIALHDDRMHATTIGQLALGERLFATIRERHRLPLKELGFETWQAYSRLLAARKK